MKLFDLHRFFELRGFNLLILFVGIYYGMKKIKHQMTNRNTYLEGMGLGFLISILSSIIFAAFMYNYVSFFDPEFMNFLIDNAPFGSYLTPMAVTLIPLLEGAASGAIMSFLMMQYLKRSVLITK